MDTGLCFSCTINGLPDDTFDVVDFTLEEALSSLFTLNVVMSSTNADIDLDSQLLQKARLKVMVDGEIKRTVNGVVAGAIRGDSGFKRTYYTFQIKPELWLLTLTKDSRIFHFKSVPDILDELLQKHQVKASCQFQDPHETREYTTQKRETDYDFFCRLAAEEGIMFWFEEDGLFYSDSHVAMTAGLDLIYNLHPQPATKEFVIDKLQYGSFMRPNEAMIKDYKYSHPDVSLDSKANQTKQRPVYSVYDSYGRFDDDKVAKQFSKYRLEAIQADCLSGTANSNCICLMPGKLFELTEHPASSMNDRWQIVSIKHHGTLPQSVTDESDYDGAHLTNEFNFIPGKIDWRPPFIHKPLADGDEVATVVGPAGEEIYVNEDGAVKVHFHWNRYDAPDENASCWVRVIQNWNGDGFGFLSTPRIGQEVLISYLNGDIDRPLVTGTTYNGKNRPPLDLPAAKTQMTIKSKTHKGDGFNEMRFEDESGKQEIFFHAQKDMNTKVLNDRSTHVLNDHTENVDNNQAMVIGVDQSLSVGQNQDGTIGNNQTLSVGNDQTGTIGNDQTLTVGNDQTEGIGSNRSVTIGSNDVLLVKGNQAETVAIAKAETIGAAKALSIGAAYQVTVAAAMNTSVGLSQSSQVGLAKDLIVGKNYSQRIGTNKDTIVGKNKAVNAGQKIEFTAGKSFVIHCGKSRLEMHQSGQITIKGVDFQLTTDKDQKFNAKGNMRLKARKIKEN